MTSRLTRRLGELRAANEKAMGIFVTNGFPTLQDTPGVLRALAAGGADFVELGMPFSDPLAEGLPIQRSSARALAGGVTMEDAFRCAADFRMSCDIPLLLMGYVNPILQYGPEAFCQLARESGIDGLIVPDLPPEESALLSDYAFRVGLDLIFLAAPNTSDTRIQKIDRMTTGFVYAVSITGLTGSGLNGRMQAIESYLERVRGLVTLNPLLVGFGIRSHEDARRLTRNTDGFIVGSALVRQIEALWENGSLSDMQRLSRVEAFVCTLKNGQDCT